MKRLIALIALASGTLCGVATAAGVWERTPFVGINRVPRGPVLAGERLVIFGRVHSLSEQCRVDRKIQLREVRGDSSVPRGVDVTDGDGEYRFVVRVARKTTFFTRLPELVEDTYGGSNVCHEAESEKLPVPVRAGRR